MIYNLKYFLNERYTSQDKKAILTEFKNSIINLSNGQINKSSIVPSSIQVTSDNQIEMELGFEKIFLTLTKMQQTVI